MTERKTHISNTDPSARRDDKDLDKVRLSRESFLNWDPKEFMGPEVAAEFGQMIMEILRENGLQEHTDPDEAYRRFPEDLFVRREYPQYLLKVIMSGEPLEINSDRGNKGRHSLNCSIWNNRTCPDSIDWVRREGKSNKAGGIYVVEAFNPRAEGLRFHDVKPLFARTVDKDDPKKEKVIDRTQYRSVEGVVQRKDMRFIVVGIPAYMFPKDQLSQAELDDADLEDYFDEREEWEETREGPAPTVQYIERVYTF